MRRYEILLPLRYNDGSLVPDSLLGEVLIAIRERFGAASSETQTIHGVWQHEGEVYRDDLVRVFADVADTAENRAWFLQLKERLKRDFDQLDIWMDYPSDRSALKNPFFPPMKTPSLPRLHPSHPRQRISLVKMTTALCSPSRTQ